MWRRTWLVFSQAVTVAVAVLFVVGTLKPEWLPGGRGGPAAAMLPTPTLVQVAPAPGRGGGARPTAGYSLAARRAAPAVVSVTATKLTRAARTPTTRASASSSVTRPPQQQQVGLGSGVIVSPEGYLLTNHHVVEDATEIEVQLADGRQTRARVVGTDVETDIAVLKIDLDNLPVMALGDVRALQVGDVVLAIGNPFNVGQTVTAGIVSALDRSQARFVAVPELHPDRRGHQPGQFRRRAGGFAGQPGGHQHGHLLAQWRQHGHRLCRAGGHRAPGDGSAGARRQRAPRLDRRGTA
jgi:serine protease DegQ